MSAPVSPGSPEPLGADARRGRRQCRGLLRNGRQRSNSACSTRAARSEIARMPLPGRTGPVFHGLVPGLGAGARYGLRAHGPWRPHEGLRFNPDKLLLDPYALALDRPFRLHPRAVSHPSTRRTAAPLRAQGGRHGAADVAKPRRRRVPWARHGHLRTARARLHPARSGACPRPCAGPSPASPIPPRIDHLKRLGVTTVELMPCAAWIDERHLHAARADQLLGLQSGRA